MRKILSIICTAVILTALCSCQKTSELQPISIPSEEPIDAPAVTGKLDFSVLKIGQADAILMQTQNHSVVIDCGEEEDGEEIAEKLSKRGITNLDYLFITHFDKDHVGGASEVLSRVGVEQLVTPDYIPSSDEYISYLKAVQKKNYAPVTLTEKLTFTLDDVLFEVYPPQQKKYSESDNDYSLLISVTHGENSFLFTGDAETVRLDEIMTQINSEYDFVKIPHHGRYNQNTEIFLESVNPSYSVITCSDKNPAEKQVTDILDNMSCDTYLTKDGDVNVVSDGQKIIITQ